MNELCPKNGFTLIEVLLALAILGIVAGVLYAAFSTTSNNIDAADSLREETDTARTLLFRISDDIANAYCTSRLSGSFFYGKKEEVQISDGTQRLDELYFTTFTGWRRPNTNETGLWEVGYFFKERADGKGQILMRREKRELGDVGPLEGGAEYELTDAVQGMQLRYFDGSKWTDEIGGKDRCALPRAVEITLVLQGGRTYATQVYREKVAE